MNIRKCSLIVGDIDGARRGLFLRSRMLVLLILLSDDQLDGS